MKKIKCLIVGCGHRSRLYAENAMNISKDFEIVGIVDPDEHILNLYADKYRVPKNMRFKNIDEVLKLGKIADCVINGTMDKLHISTSIPFLEQGLFPILRIPRSGRGTAIRCSSMTRVFLLPVSLHRKVMPIWRLSCIRCRGWRRTASRRSYASRGYSIAAARRRRSGNISWITTSSIA